MRTLGTVFTVECIGDVLFNRDWGANSDEVSFPHHYQRSLEFFDKFTIFDCSLAIEKMRAMDDAFRTQYDSTQRSHQEELRRLATDKDQQIQQARQQVRIRMEVTCSTYGMRSSVDLNIQQTPHNSKSSGPTKKIRLIRSKSCIFLTKKCF